MSTRRSGSSLQPNGTGTTGLLLRWTEPTQRRQPRRKCARRARFRFHFRWCVTGYLTKKRRWNIRYRGCCQLFVALPVIPDFALHQASLGQRASRAPSTMASVMTLRARVEDRSTHPSRGRVCLAEVLDTPIAER